METTENPIQSLEPTFYTGKDGIVPIWDHPLLKGHKLIPDKYFPQTTQEGVLNLMKRGKIDDNDFILLKVLGDAICANEDQLRRYLSTKMSRSETSKRLDRLRTYGLVDRWKVRIRGHEEEVKPPAPFTIGVGGYKLLKHYYGDSYFMDPDRWDRLGIGGLQRYVSMNEMRCQLIEIHKIKKWKWNAMIGNNRDHKFPLGAAELITENQNINLLIDRAQMGQNYIGYFREKLENWKQIFNEVGNIPVSEFPINLNVVVIFASTVSIAENIQKEIMLDTFPFDIWVCVEEDLINDGINKSFYIPTPSKLKRIKLEL